MGEGGHLTCHLEMTRDMAQRGRMSTWQIDGLQGWLPAMLFPPVTPPPALSVGRCTGLVACRREAMSVWASALGSRWDRSPPPPKRSGGWGPLLRRSRRLGAAERGPGGQTVRPALSTNRLVTNHGPCCFQPPSRCVICPPTVGTACERLPTSQLCPVCQVPVGTRRKSLEWGSLWPLAFPSRAAGGGTRAAPHSCQSLGGGGEQEGP